MDTMVYLGMWFKRIILVLLLSVFLEFLLPSNVMQRYVRLVMGMVLISVIMLPVGQLLHMDMNSIEQQVLQIFQKETTTDTSLQDILKTGEQLKQIDKDQSFSDWETHSEKLLMDQLEQRFLVKIDRVKVQADLEQNQTSPVIHALDIQVNANGPTVTQDIGKTEAQGQKTSLHIAPVQALAQIQNPGSTDLNQGIISQSKQALSMQEQTLQQQMVAFIQSQLQIPVSLIHISFDDSVRR